MGLGTGVNDPTPAVACNRAAIAISCSSASAKTKEPLEAE